MGENERKKKIDDWLSSYTINISMFQKKYEMLINQSMANGNSNIQSINNSIDLLFIELFIETINKKIGSLSIWSINQ